QQRSTAGNGTGWSEKQNWASRKRTVKYVVYLMSFSEKLIASARVIRYTRYAAVNSSSPAKFTSYAMKIAVNPLATARVPRSTGYAAVNSSSPVKFLSYTLKIAVNQLAPGRVN